jgi:predicted site-specific integrase-resolvase
MTKYYSIGQASKLLGVSIKTLRVWDQTGKLVPDTYTHGRHRRYSEASLRQFLGGSLPTSDQQLTILYGRVSSRSQKADLDHQVTALKQFCIGAGIGFDDVWTDIGSGLNYRRPRFKELIHEALAGRVQKVVIVHKDRLVRFGYELVEDILMECGVEIVVINRSEKPDVMTELAEDLIAIVQHFCSQFYGQRSHKCKQATVLVKQAVTLLETNEEEVHSAASASVE